MAQAKPLLRSFAGGEITPEMYGRLDLDKFQTGVAKALNFRILPHGPAANRAGLKYVLQVKTVAKRTRVIPFAYSADQTMTLEFGDGYIRFHTNGGTLLETGLAITGITQAATGVLTYTGTDPANGDWMYLSGIGGMTALNGRYVIVANVNAGANTFELTDLAGAAISTAAMPAYTAGGTAARVYTLASPFAEADLFDLHYTQSADVLTLVHPTYAPRELRRVGATNWTLTTPTFAPTIGTPGAPTLTTGGPGGGTPVNNNYKVTAVASDSFEESLGSASATQSYDLTVVGNHVNVDPPAVTGAVRFNVYKEIDSSGLYGYIGQTDGSALKDDNITPDPTKTPPEANNPFGSATNYPSAVTYAEQRRCFAGTDTKPQNIWMSRSATESNMCQSIPVQEDDAIIFRIAANQQNRIRHLVPLGELIALTAGGEFRIYPANSDVLTPSTVKPAPQSAVGANNVQPATAENACLYVQAMGAHVRELMNAGSVDGTSSTTYRTNDISILAPHLFDGYTMVDMAYSRAPVPTLWIVRSDGVLLGMSYVPGQNVRAWHQHTTDGTFESVSCVAESGEDVLYVVVKRNINGVDKRYIERMHTRQFAAQEDAFFVDAGATYDGAAATTISGLWHLVGEEVVALADGAVVRGKTVSAAATITLDQAASVVHVGKAYTAELQTLPLSLEVGGYGQGSAKNVSRVHVRVHNSGKFDVGPTGGRMVESKIRTTEPYGSPPGLKSGWVHVVVQPDWQDDGGITIQQDDPLPLTLVSMVLDVAA